MCQRPGSLRPLVAITARRRLTQRLNWGITQRSLCRNLRGHLKSHWFKRSGADLEVVAGEYANALNAAQTYEAETGAAQIHAYDAEATVAGQGTLAREWEEQGLEADTVLIAVGGGGLIAGSLAWLAGRRKVVAVEPENAPTPASRLGRGPRNRGRCQRSCRQRAWREEDWADLL